MKAVFMFSLFTPAALSIIAFSPGKCNPLIRLCVFCGGLCGTRKRRKRNVFTCSGHSARVAMYSRLIAEKAGLPEDACEKVYFEALLHDVGK